MTRLSSLDIQLQDNVYMGPATVVLEDLAMVGDTLRPQDSTRWGKYWSEQSTDFPSQYITKPVRVMDWDPISTYAENQNTRFVQRYFAK
jgi:hypothetical protein